MCITTKLSNDPQAQVPWPPDIRWHSVLHFDEMAEMVGEAALQDICRPKRLRKRRKSYPCAKQHWGLRLGHMRFGGRGLLTIITFLRDSPLVSRRFRLPWRRFVVNHVGLCSWPGLHPALPPVTFPPPWRGLRGGGGDRRGVAAAGTRGEGGEQGGGDFRERQV
jgi:hypothetical protein